jgi:hypothetical protein
VTPPVANVYLFMILLKHWKKVNLTLAKKEISKRFAPAQPSFRGAATDTIAHLRLTR